MKLIMENWRKYVNEAVLSEVPLKDIGRIPRSEYDPRDHQDYVKDKTRSAIGYEQSGDEQYRQKAIKMFSKTDEPWYIVLPEELGSGREKGPIRDWIKSKIKKGEWDSDGRYIAVTSQSYDGDNKTVEWQIAHDIIGHSIESENISPLLRWGITFLNKNSPDYLSPGLEGREIVTVIAPTLLYLALPENLKTAMDTNPEDVLPDILAAVFFKELTMESIANIDFEKIDKKILSPYHGFINKEVLNSLAKESLRTYMSVVNKWKRGFAPGEIRFVSPF